MLTPRSIILGDYDTHADGLWTLTGWTFSDPVPDENIVKVPGSSQPLDLSTALTDGEPTYSPRTLTATFECSEGVRMEREDRIDEMTNRLDGYRMNIYLPDDRTRYITGRVRVARLYNDLAHASVQVTATCDPWRYSKEETVVKLQATAAEQTATIFNRGRRSVVPVIIVEGSVHLTFGAASWALSAGTYQLPDIYLTPGAHSLKYAGTGTLQLTYREGRL